MSNLTKVLVTGATGNVGNAIVKLLISEEKYHVTCLVRKVEAAEKILPVTSDRLLLVKGDITDIASVKSAVEGKDLVFHAAGLPEQFAQDEKIFTEVNVNGTINVLTAAKEAGVKRAIYTSTMDVFYAAPNGVLKEDVIDTNDKPTAYERSKQQASREAEKIRESGLDLVHVNPSAVYGPNPVQTGINEIIIRTLTNDMPACLPGGVDLVYVEDVAKVHLLASDISKVKSGEMFLAGSGNLSVKEFVTKTIDISGNNGKICVPFQLPSWLAFSLARVMTGVGRAIRVKPMIPYSAVQFFTWNATVDNTKAKTQLGWKPISIDEGIKRTIEFLRAEGLVPPAPETATKI
eukprot:GFYU01011790.1.p1 GENE.GFYU01011790.1~~GFYU01011790.1.p1  ORF type:complete len:378 (+),score=116.10 GFYU01011790.1:92-1135(+)